MRKLDDRLIDQIAAGEVIERPASLVKELLENAIDAGATAITVSVEDGGRGQVRVEDDGSGMPPEDAELAIERHATSKIASFDDLVRVSTLGFRGEALASIGAVSKMTITTRPRHSVEGTRVVVEGGAVKRPEPAGCPPGTTVEVQDLFYNVPARKKFLRARQTETSRVFEVCQRLALVHPELRLVVRSDGRVARQYAPASDLAERAYQVFGDLPLRTVYAERDGLTLEAVLAPVEAARPGARQLFLFVNDRPIVDRALARAVAFAFGDRLPPGHYPRGVVSLRLPPEDVDVNAHPQKTEVRFKRGAELLDRVTRMIAARLPDASAAHDFWRGRLGALGPTVAEQPATAAEPRSQTAEHTAQYGTEEPRAVLLVAQVRSEVLVCETAREVLLIDRERADAFARFEAMSSALAHGHVERQTLLFPDRIELEPAEADALGANEAALRELGFDWSDLGERTFVVRSVPTVLADGSSAALFRGALTALRAGAAKPNALARALADQAAVPPGEPIDRAALERIAAAAEPERPDYRACILGRAPLGRPHPQRNDA